uniref:HTH CENPB-type domain-containing protein n=1 Tax=Oryzias melastigma TaxID=30732 RepID=A0A3B3BNU9_ORYME
MSIKRSFDLNFKLRAVAYANEHSGEASARHFGVDPKRIREWRKQVNDMERKVAEKGPASKRLTGGGAKKASDELEELLLTWIVEQRRKGARVSRKMIRTKAKRIFDTEIDDSSKRKETFTASAGRLDKFMKRHHLSLRRKTTVVCFDLIPCTGDLSGRACGIVARKLNKKSFCSRGCFVSQVALYPVT